MQRAAEASRTRDRQNAVAETVAKVRDIELTQGVNPQSLEAIKKTAIVSVSLLPHQLLAQAPFQQQTLLALFRAEVQLWVREDR